MACHIFIASLILVVRPKLFKYIDVKYDCRNDYRTFMPQKSYVYILNAS